MSAAAAGGGIHEVKSLKYSVMALRGAQMSKRLGICLTLKDFQDVLETKSVRLISQKDCRKIKDQEHSYVVFDTPTMLTGSDIKGIVIIITRNTNEDIFFKFTQEIVWVNATKPYHEIAWTIQKHSLVPGTVYTAPASRFH